jgi:hypothetical protein
VKKLKLEKKAAQRDSSGDGKDPVMTVKIPVMTQTHAPKL